MRAISWICNATHFYKTTTFSIRVPLLFPIKPLSVRIEKGELVIEGLLDAPKTTKEGQRIGVVDGLMG